MGIFYSYCPKCGTSRSWFLQVPTDGTCRGCGYIMTEDDFHDTLFAKSEKIQRLLKINERKEKLKKLFPDIDAT